MLFVIPLYQERSLPINKPTQHGNYAYQDITHNLCVHGQSAVVTITDKVSA